MSLPFAQTIVESWRDDSPMMVRRYSATYDSEQAAKAHAAFSPAMQL